MKKAKLLVIDDDSAILASVSEYMELEGHTVFRAADLKAAYRILENNLLDIVVTDVDLPDGNALEFLATVKTMDAPTQCILMAGCGTIDLAVRMLKEGAEQLATKPLDLSLLNSYINDCLMNQQNQRKHLAQALALRRHDKNPFLGTSPLIRQLEEEINKFVHTERPILIQGESGTGKAVLAEWIHKHGPRAEEAFVDVNCAGLSRELLEPRLFGYDKSAFTSAAASKQGLLDAAHRGILFVDEIGEMDLLVQPKLLKVLESNRFRRLGEVRERTADIQIVATTKRDLMQSVREMRFREDLYFRISTFHVRIPALRERSEDILPLANSIMQNLCADMGRDRRELSPGAQAVLRNYSWPGNIRELRNVLERMILTCDRPVVGAQDLKLNDRIRAIQPFGAEPRVTLEELERQYIMSILREEHGKVALAASRLGIPRSTLYQKIKSFGIVREMEETGT